MRINGVVTDMGNSNMEINKDTKFLVVGLGLIGGSYAMGLTKAGFEVGAIDISKESIDYAIENKIIAHGETQPRSEYIGQFDIIIIALYPHVLKEWISANQDFIKTNALITDVTGVKCCIIYDVQKLLRDDLEFIGSHPMAGREVSGVVNSDSDIFRKANFIITPTEANTLKAIDKCATIGEILGFKTITRLTPEKHDEMIAFLSQLTHCIAISLMTCRESEHFIDYTGDSFRDLTRIAKINDEMWTELFLSNKEKLLEQMDLFVRQFNTLRNYILNDDVEGLKEIMRNSTIKRKLFDEALSDERK